MQKIKKNLVITSLIYIAIFLAIGTFISKYFFPQNDFRKIKETDNIIESAKKLVEQQETILPEITIQDFHMKEINEEKSKNEIWILNSKRGKIFKKTNTIECTDVHCTLIRDDENIANLQANKSILDRNTKRVFLSGLVSGNLKELNILGKNINYDFSNQTLKTNNALTYTYPNFTLTAQQSFVDLKENKIEMKNGIKTEILSDFANLNNPTSNNS